MSLGKLTHIHHAAYRCCDAEQTRWFYEDVLGLRYRAALTSEEVSGTSLKREYMHLFEMEDGNLDRVLRRAVLALRPTSSNRRTASTFTSLSRSKTR
ncbi:MAG: VOC family protein [Hyphomonas sp.]